MDKSALDRNLKWPKKVKIVNFKVSDLPVIEKKGKKSIDSEVLKKKIIGDDDLMKNAFFWRKSNSSG